MDASGPGSPFDFLSRALTAASLGQFLDDISGSGLDISDLTVADLRRLYEDVHGAPTGRAGPAGGGLGWEEYWTSRLAELDRDPEQHEGDTTGG